MAKKNPKKSSLLAYLAILIGTIFIIAISMMIGYNYGKKEFEQKIEKQKDTNQELLKKLKEIVDVSSEEQVDSTHEYDASIYKDEPPEPQKREEKAIKSGAKLVIIIDDMATARDVEIVKSTKLNLTMSFLPPNEIHPDSAKLANIEDFYMVHLPLEAMNHNSPEPITLKSGSSSDEISSQIDRVLELFPRVKYINNHTGSKFTDDKSSMDILLRVLSSKNIKFVDSRTIGSTKAPEVSKELGLRYVGRDVFLDHEDGVSYAQKQIREAVSVAKKHGYAIAIGHPRKDTIEALIRSRELLKEVELVRIDKI